MLACGRLLSLHDRRKSSSMNFVQRMMPVWREAGHGTPQVSDIGHILQRSAKRPLNSVRIRGGPKIDAHSIVIHADCDMRRIRIQLNHCRGWHAFQPEDVGRMADHAARVSSQPSHENAVSRGPVKSRIVRGHELQRKCRKHARRAETGGYIVIKYLQIRFDRCSSSEPSVARACWCCGTETDGCAARV